MTGHSLFEVRKIKRLWVTAIILLLASFQGNRSPLFAQQAVTSATLSGFVEDESGARVPKANITAHNHDRNQNWTATGTEDGRFQFLTLPVGSYELKVEAKGFAPFLREFPLSIGQAQELPVRLQVAGSTESIQVIGEIPVIETVRTQLTETVGTREIDNLPLNGRQFLDLALLSPAVSRTNTGNTDRFAETSAVSGTGISIAGQRNLNNGFVVDGLSSNDDAADLPLTFFSQDVIREFQVVTSGGIAEYGRASSGFVNILTESGTNKWHGDAYGFFRNQRFDGTNIFAAANPATGTRIKSPWTQTQEGISIGGPLRRDRAFLYFNFEREDLHRSGFITISPASVAAINPVLDQAGYAPPRVTTGNYSTGDGRSNVFAKADYNLSQDHRLATRYSLYDISAPNARLIGGLSAVSRGTRVADRDQTIAVNEVATLSSSAVNEGRFQFTHSHLDAPGNDLIGPSVTISGVANFGASTSSPTERGINLLEFADNYSTQRGNHFLKAGVDVLYERVNIVYPATFYGSYTFTSLANFSTGAYSTFAQAFGKVDWFQTNPNLGWFIQDEWKPRHGLTINAGIRHDVQWLANDIHTSMGNISPRLGLAYAPGSHKTVLRASFGQYYDRIPLRAIANALRGSGLYYQAISVQRGQVGSPVFPNKLASVPPGLLISLASIDPNIKNGYGLQANLQVERELTSSTSVSVGYLHLRGIHIIMQRNLNVPACTSAQDPVDLCRPNPSYQNINQYSGQGDSYYNGMTLSLQQRASSWGMARFSYTFSKSIDDAGTAFFYSAQNQLNIREDRGLADSDQRHRLTLSGQLAIPKLKSSPSLSKAVEGFQLSGIFSYSSPYPFNVVTGGQTIQTTAARPSGLGRNTGVGFAFATLDFRLSRKFPVTERLHMETMAEFFNVLNHTNLLLPNNTYGTGAAPLPSFGKPTAAADPRQIQFGLRFSF